MSDRIYDSYPEEARRQVYPYTTALIDSLKKGEVMGLPGRFEKRMDEKETQAPRKSVKTIRKESPLVNFWYNTRSIPDRRVAGQYANLLQKDFESSVVLQLRTLKQRSEADVDEVAFVLALFAQGQDWYNQEIVLERENGKYITTVPKEVSAATAETRTSKEGAKIWKSDTQGVRFILALGSNLKTVDDASVVAADVASHLTQRRFFQGEDENGIEAFVQAVMETGWRLANTRTLQEESVEQGSFAGQQASALKSADKDISKQLTDKWPDLLGPALAAVYQRCKIAPDEITSRQLVLNLIVSGHEIASRHDQPPVFQQEQDQVHEVVGKEKKLIEVVGYGSSSAENALREAENIHRAMLTGGIIPLKRRKESSQNAQLNMIYAAMAIGGYLHDPSGPSLAEQLFGVPESK